MQRPFSEHGFPRCVLPAAEGAEAGAESKMFPWELMIKARKWFPKGWA